MTHCNHNDRSLFIVDLVKNPILPDTQAVAVLAREFLRARRTSIAAQSEQLRHDFARNPLRDPIEILSADRLSSTRYTAQSQRPRRSRK